MVALTFDDGPDPLWTPRILDELAHAHARATFFMLTERAAEHPALIARARDEGHAVELHGHAHIRHPAAGRDAVTADLRTALGILRELGVTPRRWRLPWGDVAPWSAGLAAEHGLQLTGWTLDTEDWRDRPTAALLAAVEPGLALGAVVLAHDGLGPGAERTGCGATAELVAPLVEAIRRRGLEPVPLDRGWSAPIPVGNPALLGSIQA